MITKLLAKRASELRKATSYTAAVVLFLLTNSVLIRAEEYGGAFADAVSKAQKCTVKVLGAGVGTRSVGYATGVLVSDDGLIVTAHGVHLNAQQLRVTLDGGQEHPAKVVRRHLPLHLALLKIDVPTPEFFELSPEPVGQKGDWVVGVTNAFKVADGPEPLSVTLGIISMRTQLEAKHGVLDIDYVGEVLLLDCITSNPGAPGGAVVAADGQLAGMVGRIIESKGTNTRINYAVPTDVLYSFLHDKLPAESAASKNPVVVRRPITGGKADLGIRLFKLGGRRGPAYVDRVVRRGPAAEAGVKSDDLIVSLAGRAVRNIREYEEIVKSLKNGEDTTVIVKRGNKLVSLTITAK